MSRSVRSRRNRSGPDRCSLLPDELLLNVLCYLSCRHTLSVTSRVSRRLGRLAGSPAAYRKEVSFAVSNGTCSVLDRHICGMRPTFRHVTRLGVRGAPRVSSQALAESAPHLPALQALDLSHHPLVDNGALVEFAKHCPMLSELLVIECPRITSAGLLLFAQSCQALDLRLTLGNVHYWRRTQTDGRPDELREAISACASLRSLDYQGPVAFDFLSRTSIVAALKPPPLCSIVNRMVDADDLMMSPARNQELGEQFGSLFGASLQALELCIHTSDERVGALDSDSFLDALLGRCQQLRHLVLEKWQLPANMALITLNIASLSISKSHLPAAVHGHDCSLVSMFAADRHPMLRSLDLSHCVGITSAALAAVAPRLAQLTTLRVTGLGICSSAHASDMATALRAFGASLLHFDAGSTGAGDELCDAVAAHCPRLERLSLARCTSVTDAGLRRLAAGCACLRHLDLTRCGRVTDAGVTALARAMPLMRRADLILLRCTQIRQGDMLLRD